MSSCSVGRNGLGSDPMKEPLTFHPTLLGAQLEFEEGEIGMITDETQCEVYIESDFFTGWTSKALFWELSGESFTE